MRHLKVFIILFLFVLSVGPASTGVVFASATDGTIDSAYKYAFGENIGWINFGVSGGNVHVTDSVLTGYAWSDNYGWINLNPTNGGVLNNSEGVLSGHAWGQSLGWINFSGVTINSSGEFLGYASTTNNSGRISFNCSNTSSCGSSDFKVKTDWRPASSRTTSSAGGGGGGALPPEAYSPPASPYGVLINNGAEVSDNRIVVLQLIAGSDVKMMAISNKSDFKNAVQEPYAAVKIWDICHQPAADKEKCPEGDYAVYVKFYTAYGRTSEAQDGIVYKIAPPSSKTVFKKITDKALEILEPIIPEFLKPARPPEETEQKPVEEIVSKEPPLAMSGKWRLISYLWQGLPFEKFVSAPLPKEIKILAQKFPEFEKTLKQTGVQKLIDVEKLKAVKLVLPGLDKKAEFKQEFPSEIVFVRTGGQKINFNIALEITDKGKPLQKISVIAGKPLHLTVKPANRANSVKGYVVFKSRGSKLENQKLQSSNFNLQDLLASTFFAAPSFVEAHDPIEIEEQLVLIEFEYIDPDGDGIYTAEIQAPAVDGEYEIITVMDYEDPELGTKEIRLIAVVDPEGYVYEKIKNQELRIVGAIVSLFWLNPENKKYELWPAEKYQQENPQITDKTGKYAFLTPAGSYYLKAEAPSYPVYESGPFQVEEGGGAHMNIELKTGYWWLKAVDWKTFVLILLIILSFALLFYNFYRDKIRERKSESV